MSSSCLRVGFRFRSPLRCKVWRSYFGLALGSAFCAVLPSVAIAAPFAESDPSCSAIASDSTLTRAALPKAEKSEKASALPLQEAYLPPPSLWWAKEQFDPFGGRLIESWRADERDRQVDLILNRQLWAQLDYVNRYRFVNQLGAIVRDSHFNLRAIDAQNRCLATYRCQFDTVPATCDLTIEPTEPLGVRAKPVPYEWQSDPP